MIDEMRLSDWEQVRQIYLDGIATGQATFETDAPTWMEWDESHLKHSRLVAREDGRVIAWAALAPVSRRRCYAGAAELSLYVSPEHRGKGLGKSLMQAVIEASERNGIWSLSGSTFPENGASIRLQKACGFRIVGRRVRIAQHHGIWRDTVLTERRSKVVGIVDTPTRT